MSKDSLESILDAARRLPADQQRLLAERLMHQESGKRIAHQINESVEAVERTRGSMKGLDRDTIIWLAEDEELCGY